MTKMDSLGMGLGAARDELAPLAAEEPNYRHRRLLRACRKRPCRCAAEQVMKPRRFNRPSSVR